MGYERNIRFQCLLFDSQVRKMFIQFIYIVILKN